MELIELKGVSKEYRKSTVIRDVNLTIEEGDILGVIGQSGSGKTTLLNLITGFIEPTDGEVVYFSQSNHERKNLTENLFKIKKKIGFTPQHNSLYPKLTVQENVLHFGRLYGMDEKVLQSNIKNLLKFTKLADHQHKLAEHLSGGMQKRLDLCCSLVHKPKILVLDEPTSDLDPVLQKEILQMLQEVNKQGVTLVIASHHLDSIENMCNKVVIVHKGLVHSHGLLDDIRKPFLRDHFTINIHSGKEKEKMIEKLKSFSIRKIVDKGNTLVIYPADVQKTTQELLTMIKEENLFLHDMNLRKPSLREIFEKIVQEN